MCFNYFSGFWDIGKMLEQKEQKREKLYFGSKSDVTICYTGNIMVAEPHDAWSRCIHSRETVMNGDTQHTFCYSAQDVSTQNGTAQS